MDLDVRYFYISCRGYFMGGDPNLVEIAQKTYKEENTGNIYRRRKLYDCGVGQEDGYEKLPSLTFDKLIELVIQYDDADGKLRKAEKFSNLLGAISVIMEDHITEFIDFLADKILTDFFENSQIRRNFKFFSFDEKDNTAHGGILTKSYEEILKQYPQWNKISSKVKEIVYRKITSEN